MFTQAKQAAGAGTNSEDVPLDAVERNKIGLHLRAS
jgi:hypothetical protein